MDTNGIPAMFFGQPQSHAPDVYQMYKWVKRSLLLSKTGMWLDKTYAELNMLPKENIFIMTPTEQIGNTISEILDNGGGIPIAETPLSPKRLLSRDLLFNIMV